MFREPLKLNKLINLTQNLKLAGFIFTGLLPFLNNQTLRLPTSSNKTDLIKLTITFIMLYTYYAVLQCLRNSKHSKYKLTKLQVLGHNNYVNINIQILCNAKRMATVVKVGRQLMWQLWTAAHDGTQHSIIIYITRTQLRFVQSWRNICLRIGQLSSTQRHEKK